MKETLGVWAHCLPMVLPQALGLWKLGASLWDLWVSREPGLLGVLRGKGMVLGVLWVPWRNGPTCQETWLGAMQEESGPQMTWDLAGLLSC